MTGSFAEYAVVRYLPEIVRRLLADNWFFTAAIAYLRTLEEYLRYRHIHLLLNGQALDWEAWQQSMQVFIEQMW